MQLIRDLQSRCLTIAAAATFAVLPFAGPPSALAQDAAATGVVPAAEAGANPVPLQPLAGQDTGLPVPATPVALTDGPAQRAYNPLVMQETIRVSDLHSLFFSPDALALIRDAQSGLNTLATTNADGSPVEPGIRELSLGGLVYNGAEDWTIWLNSRRITADTIPEQVFDLDVTGDYVDIKWYDRYTNRLYPVRLRPHERFHLDSRLFLVGASPASQTLY